MEGWLFFSFKIFVKVSDHFFVQPLNARTMMPSRRVMIRLNNVQTTSEFAPALDASLPCLWNVFEMLTQAFCWNIFKPKDELTLMTPWLISSHLDKAPVESLKTYTIVSTGRCSTWLVSWSWSVKLVKLALINLFMSGSPEQSVSHQVRTKKLMIFEVAL